MKNKKILLSLIAFLVIVSGYFVWTTHGDDITFRISPTSTPTPDPEYADWNTYTNDEYGFSIKYPKNWFVREEIQNETSFTQGFSYNSITTTTLPYDVINFTLSSENNPIDKTQFWSFSSEKFDYLSKQEIGTKTAVSFLASTYETEFEIKNNFGINGYSCYLVDIKAISEGTEPFYNSEIECLINHKIYKISASHYDNRSDLPEISEKMIKSIQFDN
ncbi:hypothetical protein COX84_05655 [Candidatus Micrarchaeota archaeon CG_4_10_14_0_2_um_filter_49_7]|nr:MAG: hypothetical protein COX84_05655 [Candidatus Micrarchaeota archaeon CG_4_10_14_0_2_um_filter_49_7]